MTSLSLDKGEEVILVLLDFSCAFDIIKLGILSQRLKLRFGINGRALMWRKPYLYRRTHTVVIGNERSSRQGPSGVRTRPNLIHSIYISSRKICNIIETHTTHKMFYADDTQLYIAFKRNYVVDVTTEISNCVRSVKEWSQMNGVKLNNIKTGFFMVPLARD